MFQGEQTGGLLDCVRTEMRLRNYSIQTQKAYIQCLSNFFVYLIAHQRDHILPEPGSITDQNIIEFILSQKERGLAPKTLNLHLGAIKFFYQQVLRCERTIQIPFSKEPKRLPVVLAKEEIVQLLSTIKNSKHQLLIALAYAAGLRVGEVVSLRVEDVDIAREAIHLKSAKGSRDRISVLPQSILPALRMLIGNKSRQDFVFHSERGGRLHTRTAQLIFARACKKAGIMKSVTFHSLRHSFATHLVESGMDIRYIQTLLGHKNIRTTEIYTHVTSPALLTIMRQHPILDILPPAPPLLSPIGE